METSISSHYSNYSPSFRYKIFNLQNAIHSKSKVPVTIWTFNTKDYLQNHHDYSQEKVNNFINKFRISLYASQKIDHPNILRIFEITEEDTDQNVLSFSSEQIKFCANGIGTKTKNNLKYTQDESLFLFSQIANGILYLQTELKVAHFAICPENIFITPQFDIKISNLVYFSRFFDITSIIEPSLFPISTSFFDIDSRFPSPELKEHRNLTANADIYMLGLTVLYCYEGNSLLNELIEHKDQPKFIVNYLNTCNSIPDDIKELIKPFFNENPIERPKIIDIANSRVLSPLIIKVLDFIDSVSEKPIENRKSFYNGLSRVINQFSSRILIAKFIPVLVNDVVLNPLDTEFLQQQLLPMLITSSSKLSLKKIDCFILSKIWSIPIAKNYLVERSEEILSSDQFVHFICLICTVVLNLYRNADQKYLSLLTSFFQKVQKFDKFIYNPIFKHNEFINLFISEIPNQNLSSGFIQSFVSNLFPITHEKMPSLIPVLLKSFYQIDSTIIEQSLLPFFENFSTDNHIQVKCILKIIENSSLFINSFIEKLVRLTVLNCAKNEQIMTSLSILIPMFLAQAENIESEIIEKLLKNETDYNIIVSNLGSVKNIDLKIDILRLALIQQNDDPSLFALTFIDVSVTQSFYEKYKNDRMKNIQTDFIQPLFLSKESSEIVINNFQSFESIYHTSHEIQRLIIKYLLENESKYPDFVEKIPELIEIYKPDQDETLTLLQLNKNTHSLLMSVKGQIDREHLQSFCVILNDLYERGNDVVNDIVDVLIDLPPATEHSYIPISLALKLVDDKSLDLKQIDSLLTYVDMTVNAIREFKSIKPPDVLTNGSSGNPFSSKNIPPQETHFNQGNDSDEKKDDMFSPPSGDALFGSGQLQSNDSTDNPFSSLPQHAAINPFQDDTIPTEDPFAIHNSNDPGLKEINQLPLDLIDSKPKTVDPFSLPMHTDPFSSPPKPKDNSSKIPINDPFNTPSNRRPKEESGVDKKENEDKKKKKHDKKKKDKKKKTDETGNAITENPFKKKVASDPFSLPLDTDPFNTASLQSQHSGLSSNSLADNQEDPITNSTIVNPFKEPEVVKKADLFTNSTIVNQPSPFKNSEVADPFKDSKVANLADPFKNTQGVNNPNRFSNSTIVNQPDPFKNPGNNVDPFQHSTISDPFAQNSHYVDPFKQIEQHSHFSTPKQPKQPFQGDPFANTTSSQFASTPKNGDPFSTPSKEDPSSNPFNNPKKTDDNPFSSNLNKSPYQTSESNDKSSKNDEDSSSKKHGKKHHHSKKRINDSAGNNENELKASKRKKSHKSTKNTQAAHQSAQPQTSFSFSREKGQQNPMRFTLFESQQGSSTFQAKKELHRVGSSRNSSIHLESDDFTFEDD